jgi:hypothetical protein
MVILYAERYVPASLTGYVNVIPVSGDFRDAHNIFAIVSASPTK